MEPGNEFEGRSLEEALGRAGDTLGRPVTELKYEVVEDIRRGFFGLRKRLVRIRIIGRGPAAAPVAAGSSAPDWQGGAAKAPSDRSGEPGRAKPPAGRTARATGEEAGRDRAGGRQGWAREGASKESALGGRDRGIAAGSTAKTAPERGAERQRHARGRHRRGGRPDFEKSKGADHSPGLPQEEPSRPTRPLPPFRLPQETAYSKQEAVRLVAGHILRAMNLDLRAKLRDREGAVVLELGGHDAPLLLEHDGEALEALQHLLNKILARDERFDTRVVVDCEGFRNHRDEEIVERAKRGAEEALRTGQPVHIDGLNPYERRLAHLALAEQKRVRTFSTGEGAVKRLTIEPVAGDARAEEA